MLYLSDEIYIFIHYKHIFFYSPEPTSKNKEYTCLKLQIPELSWDLAVLSLPLGLLCPDSSYVIKG